MPPRPFLTTARRADRRPHGRRATSALLPCLVAALLAGTGAPAEAQRPLADRRIAGFSTARLARIDSLLEAEVASGRIAGAVALVLRDDTVVYERAVGWADREAGRRMTPDAIVRIASQTKALTSAAVLRLVERGQLSLDDRLDRFIPAFRTTRVATRVDTGVALVPARRPITIRHLLTHTAGVSYGTDRTVSARYEAAGLGPAAGFGWYTADKDEPVCATMERLGTLPIVAHPGEAYVYGYATDLLGCVVERVDGRPLDRFLAEEITTPLGMRDTHFFLPPAKRNRLAAVYRTDSTGRAVRADTGARGQGHYVDGPRRNFAGGAGLVSTAHDYGRFLRMIAGGGALDGVRVLAPRTVALMATNQSGTLHSTDGLGFGFGFQVTERFGANGLASTGSYGWGGAYGSTYLVDPAEGLVILFMLQQLPRDTDIAIRYRAAVYHALVAPRRALP